MDVEYLEKGIKLTQNDYSKNLLEMKIEEPLEPTIRLSRKEYEEF